MGYFWRDYTHISMRKILTAALFSEKRRYIAKPESGFLFLLFLGGNASPAIFMP
ncbi:hypothetical protein ymoll0001_1780 [Yersinia mollaretii ATCC 43969]|uniref:Uncharacterized protein n=1 Tax=Yersinia mollaretii (strain ATCC 43969 / DSM 18520 / CIP 103324 / CNY 7263 / WAIP 204) TaxID=349967 RepID=A0ABP2EER1_YERMW|nr:hypothetical protein ymoll0001_1780 [Yersinia mollaretii ATCC 43969]